MSPQSDPNLQYKQYIVLILCFMLIIAGFLLGWYITILWAILSLALSLTLYVWAFHIHWRARR